MTDRVLTQEDKDKMLAALEKGNSYALNAIAKAPENRQERTACLTKEFETALWAGNRAVENFNLSEFEIRKNAKETPEMLMGLLSLAFQMAQRAEVLKNELNKITASPLFEERVSDFQKSLSKAVSVYKSNGDHDLETTCAREIIDSYRASKTSPSPANTPMNRAS